MLHILQWGMVNNDTEPHKNDEKIPTQIGRAQHISQILEVFFINFDDAHSSLFTLLLLVPDITTELL